MLYFWCTILHTAGFVKTNGTIEKVLIFGRKHDDDGCRCCFSERMLPMQCYVFCVSFSLVHCIDCIQIDWIYKASCHLFCEMLECTTWILRWKHWNENLPCDDYQTMCSEICHPKSVTWNSRGSARKLMNQSTGSAFRGSARHTGHNRLMHGSKNA